MSEMHSLVSSIDERFNIQFGENNHKEYKWSSNKQEKILQLYYQLVRTTNEKNIDNLKKIFVQCFIEGTESEKKILCKIILNTRDIKNGKGEYNLSLILLKELYFLKKELAIQLLKKIVGFLEKDGYGSWKDVKYFLKLFKEDPTKKEELLEIYQMMIEQLKKDEMEMLKNSKDVSLLAKWVPRETSKKFGYIHEILAKEMFPYFGGNGWSNKALNKANMKLRKRLSSLNKYLDTTQIKQCKQDWKNIIFDNVTSITMMKQKKAFLKTHNHDREECSKNLQDYLVKVMHGKKTVKGGQNSMVDFVKQGIYCNDENEMIIINEAWKDKISKLNNLENVIAMVDTSGSMEDEKCVPLYTAVGLGCCVAEKSKLGKRVITFSNNPSWINLENCNNFCEMVKTIKCDENWGFNTDYYKALEMILEGIEKTNMKEEEVNKLVLIIFSDMQFDKSCNDKYDDVILKNIEKKFSEVGMKICNKPYKVPHIVFWNLKSTNGFPEKSNSKNITMISGYSPYLVNSLLEEGIEAIEKRSSWDFLMIQLKKYDWINEINIV